MKMLGFILVIAAAALAIWFIAERQPAFKAKLIAAGAWLSMAAAWLWERFGDVVGSVGG